MPATARKRVRVQDVQSPPAGGPPAWQSAALTGSSAVGQQTPRVFAPLGFASPMCDAPIESAHESARRMSFTTPFKVAPPPLSKDANKTGNEPKTPALFATPGVQRSILKRRVPLPNVESPNAALQNALPFSSRPIGT